MVWVPLVVREEMFWYSYYYYYLHSILFSLAYLILSNFINIDEIGFVIVEIYFYYLFSLILIFFYKIITTNITLNLKKYNCNLNIKV
jgi:hypothetical protein